MKTYLSMLTLHTLLLLAPVTGVSTDPVSKVVSMISKLQQEVIREGQDGQRLYNEFSEMCSDRSRQLHQEIKTGKSKVAELSATIEKATADLTVLQDKISDGADQTDDDDSDLQKATALRKKEATTFKADEQELLSTISTLERAMVVIERDGPGASLAQVEHMQSVTQVLQTMVEASTVDSSNAATLTALLQASSGTSTDSAEDEDETAAPAAAAYEGQSSGIVQTLEGLLDKAKQALEDARQTETNNLNAYQMLKQSLEAKLKTLGQAMADSKKAKAGTGEVKASAEGDREATTKDLNEDVKELKELHHECLDRATSFEEATSSRDEELKALAQAKGVIIETTGGAAKQKYSLVQISFLQVRSKDTSSTGLDALHVVRRMAFDLHSRSLIDLTTRITKAIKSSGAAGSNPFGKVRGMIESMISKLQAEAESEATKKSYCDKQLSESGSSKEDKEDSIEKLSTKVDGMTAASKKLKGEVMQLRKELASLARTQAEMDKLRAEEKANYNKNKPLMEQGLEGVKTALKVLRDYYAKGDKSSDKSSGAASGIVGMLEVVESDFSKSLAELMSAEESAETEYEAVTQENKIAKAVKEEAAKFKTAEHVSVDKSISESKADKAGVGEELDAVVQYLSSIKKDCIAKPDSYEARKTRREKEMAGLHEALETLNGDAMLLQVSSSHKTLRGTRRFEASV